jgi:hypothetical protein
MMGSKALNPLEWHVQNNVYCQSRPQIYTRLTYNLIERLTNPQPHNAYEQNTEEIEGIVQILLIKFCDQNSGSGLMKARIMISDGRRACIALLHSAIHEKINLSEN